MEWLLLLILILLVIGFLWWLSNRNRSTSSAPTPPPPPAEEPSEAAPTATPVEPDLRSADTPTTSAPAPDTGPGAPDLHGVTTPGKFGEGSADSAPDGSGPAGWRIKASEESMKFHTEDSPWYERTVAEVWFDSEERAAAAGFKRWDDRS